MRLKMITAMFHDDGHCDQFGDIVEVENETAKRMIAAGIAVLASQDEAETVMLEQAGRGAPLHRATRKGVI